MIFATGDPEDQPWREVFVRPDPAAIVPSPRRPLIDLAIASAGLIVLVAALALAAFPVDFLDGAAAFWHRPKGDLAEHIVGARYFLADEWRLPLLLVPDLGLAPGTNIGMTDSIPVAALAAKLLRGVIGAGQPYIPVWILLCYIAQGPAAAIALYGLGVQRIAPMILGGLLLVFTPVLLFRFGHAALCSHFLVLLALALHVRLVRTAVRRRALLLYVPLLVLTLLVHIYLLAMVFAVMMASLLHGLWTERLTIGEAVAQLAASGLALGLVMWVCGYFQLGSIPMKGYGEYALDLAAPFVPGPSGLLGVSGLPYGRGYEGFAWLGAGMALLIPVALVAWRRQLGAIAGGHLPTVLVAGAALILALSYAVRIGPVLVLGIGSDTVRHALLDTGPGDGALHRLVAALGTTDFVRIAVCGVLVAGLATWLFVHAWRLRRLSFLWFLTVAIVGLGATVLFRPSAVALVVSSFQASGRFVWIVTYLASLLAIAAVWQAFRPPTALSLLGLALALQVADTAPLWRALQRDAVAQPDAIADESAIAAAFAGAQVVNLVPTYNCAYAEPIDPPDRDALVERIVDLQVLASRTARPTNSVRHSRLAATDLVALAASCTAERDRVLSQSQAPGTLTLVLKDVPAEAEARHALASRPDCRALQLGVLCLPPGR